MTDTNIQALLFEATKRATMRSYYDSKIRLRNRFERSTLADVPQITPVS